MTHRSQGRQGGLAPALDFPASMVLCPFYVCITLYESLYSTRGCAPVKARGYFGKNWIFRCFERKFRTRWTFH